MVITLRKKITILILYIILTERKKKETKKKMNPNLSLHGRTTKSYIRMYTYNIISSGIT